MVSRRQFVGMIGTTAVAGIAGCSDDGRPEKSCVGDCQYIDQWKWEYHSGTAFADPEFFIMIIPTSDAPVLDVGISGYFHESLAHATTETIGGRETFRYIPGGPVKAVEINVSEANDDS